MIIQWWSYRADRTIKSNYKTNMFLTMSVTYSPSDRPAWLPFFFIQLSQRSCYHLQHFQGWLWSVTSGNLQPPQRWNLGSTFPSPHNHALSRLDPSFCDSAKGWEAEWKIPTHLVTETLHNLVNRRGKGSQLVNTHTQACTHARMHTHTAGDRNITQSGKQKWKGQSAGEHTYAHGERNLAEV